MSDDTVVYPDRFQQKADQIESEIVRRLKNGDGGGTSDGMEARMTKLEADVSDIRVTLARIEGKLDSKVDYKWMIAYFAGLVMIMLREEILAILGP